MTIRLTTGALAALGFAFSPVALAKGRPAAPKGAPAAAKADSAPVDAAPAAVPAVPAEKVLEKKGEGPYSFRLTLRPGVLQPHDVADVSIEFFKRLDGLDPATGDRGVLTSPDSYAVVRGPLDAKKGAAETVYRLWSRGPAAGFGFHFTPASDGLYELKLVGFDTVAGDGKAVPVSFKVGVGSASGQTELTQETGSTRRGARRPVGGGDVSNASAAKLQKLMEEVGRRTLGLETRLAAFPPKGGHVDAAAEASQVASLFAQVKGLTPRGTELAAGEFDVLAEQASTAFTDLATSLKADGKPAEKAARQSAAQAALEKLQGSSCLACHAKFRWGVTTDLSAWPSFEHKPWKK
jgi:cytochrome c5